jgi:phospholipid/cholesterol/gamma-HCH transport system substrate-binding protein
MNQALKVGIFGVIALSVLAYLILQVEQWSPFAPEGVRYQAAFDSVAGLDDKASVRVAGVVVGRVDGVGLKDGQALVTLLLERPVELREGASARIANLGILGDKYVTLDPGPPGAAALSPGAVLAGEAPVSFDDALARLDGLAGSLQESFGSLGGGGQESAIRRLLDSLEATSNEIGLLVADNRGQISTTVGHFADVSATLSRELPRLAEQMERVLSEIEGVVGENRGDLRQTMEQVRDATDGIRVSIRNLNEISGRLARGEGTVGKLLTSEETHDRLLSTMGTIESGVQELSDTLGRVRKLRLDLGFDSYWLEEIGETRTSFSIDLDPQSSDRFYRLGLVDDPRGRVRVSTDVTTVTMPDGTTETSTVRQVRTEDKATLDAQFGFRVGSAASLRAGLFQTTAGLALDWEPVEDRFSLSLEAYDFGREEDLDPHLRLIGRWRVHPNFFFQGGYDDFLEGDRDSIFFGGGLRWSDDDLKYLLGSLPTGSF